MRAPIVTMPGKIGDLVYALRAVRRLRDIYGAPVHFVTSPFAAAALTLVNDQPDLVESVSVFDGYRIASTEPGLQPYVIPAPKDLTEDGRRDVFHLGFRRFPLPHEDIADALASPYNITDLPPGPWLRRVRVDRAGPVIAHAPIATRQDFVPVLRQLIAKHASKPVHLVGSIQDFVAYQEHRLDTLENVSLLPTEDMLDIWRACDGASGFVGFASSPAAVAQGAGLPSKVVIPPGGRRWCLPRGCAVEEVR